jgi:hypothetical protein
VSGGYAPIDAEIGDWVTRHSLRLFISFAGIERRFVYLSSVAGECFQISIDPPETGMVSIHVSCVEGRWDDDPPKDIVIPATELEPALERAITSVAEWMAPSTRHFPSAEV